MGRINFDEVENYKGGDFQNSFFNLENDRDVAKVRFCYEDVKDIEIITTHTIEIDGKKRKVACLRNYNDPLDKCPFCNHQISPVQVRFFLSLLKYDRDKKATKMIWERGKTFQKDILSLASRYNPLCDTVFEIERQGKKGETTTRYAIFPTNDSLEDYQITNEDLENDSVLGTIVLEKTAEEMEYYVENGEFPKKEENRHGSNEYARRESTSQPNNNLREENNRSISPVSGARRRI